MVPDFGRLAWTCLLLWACLGRPVPAVPRGQSEEGLERAAAGPADSGPWSRSRRLRRQSAVLSAAQHQAYVDKHNELRAQVVPTAANMEHMVYNAEMSATALAWSKKCDFRHSTSHPTLTLTLSATYGADYGENLAAQTLPTQPDVSDIVQAWFDETNSYTFATDSCEEGEQCGHYTQIAWATSTRVGCGMHFCPRVRQNETDFVFNGEPTWMITCHYAPAGNYENEKPYISGPSCTKCSSGSGYCLNNICVGQDQCTGNDQCACRIQCYNCGTVDRSTCTCQCPTGWIGGDCSIPRCADLHEDCATVAQLPDIHCPNGNTAEICPLTCSVCQPPGNPTCANPDIPNTYETTDPEVDPGTDTEVDPGTDTNVDPGTDTGVDPGTDTGVDPGTDTNVDQGAPSTCTTTCGGGGVLQSNDCTCRCNTRYQGDRCQYFSSQVPYTVYFHFRHDISRFSFLRSLLLSGIAGALNTYCAQTINHAQCCPGITLPANTNGLELPEFTTAASVEVAVGYPEAGAAAGRYAVGTVAARDASPALCLALANAGASRRRRGADPQVDGLTRVKRQASVPYIDSDLLYAATSLSIGDIEQGLAGAGEDAELLSLTQNPDGPTAGPTDVGGVSTGLVVGVVAAAVAVLFLLLLICACFFLSRGGDPWGKGGWGGHAYAEPAPAADRPGPVVVYEEGRLQSSRPEVHRDYRHDQLGDLYADGNDLYVVDGYIYTYDNPIRTSWMDRAVDFHY